MTDEVVQQKGWIPWNGGDCPVSFTTKVQVKLRDGATERVRDAGYWMRKDDDRCYWQHEPNDEHNDIVAYRLVSPPTPEPAQPAESPEALLAHLKAIPMTEWVWTDAERIFATLAATTARPTERQHDTIRREGSCYWQAADDIMAFINALDSSEMSGKDVRSAIYGRCLEMRPKSRPTERGAVEAIYRARRSVNEGYAANKADLTNADLRIVLERLDAALTPPVTVAATDQAGEEGKCHHIKCWPDVFEEMRAGRKTAEFRYNDRGYQVGDTLLIREWDTATSTYTHREITRRISHVLDGGFGMPTGYAMLSLATQPATGRTMGGEDGLRAALDWALSEIEGRTRYDNSDQRQNCIDIANDALAASKKDGGR